MSNLKKCGKNIKRVFLDVFSPPENDSGVRLPVKNLVPALENWWAFAVHHYISIGFMQGAILLLAEVLVLKGMGVCDVYMIARDKVVALISGVGVATLE